MKHAIAHENSIIQLDTICHEQNFDVLNEIVDVQQTAVSY